MTLLRYSNATHSITLTLPDDDAAFRALDRFAVLFGEPMTREQRERFRQAVAMQKEAK